jgi:hypothetical protein
LGPTFSNVARLEFFTLALWVQRLVRPKRYRHRANL